tara:strand:+ start:888 stop:1685 length:798 start_codon:yes stop_codon:yes gene_type:complete
MFEYVWLATTIATIGLGAIGIHYGMTKKKDKEKRIRGLLFEQVGNDKVFKGEIPLYESSHGKLGVYILLKKEQKAISDVRNDDFFFDRQYGKCLLIIKYADDDYRVMSRMKTGEWFKQVYAQKFKTTKEIDKETGETIEKKEPLLDKNGEPTYDVSLKAYEESLGVDQDSRTAMRFDRQFNDVMDEWAKEKKKGLDKWMPMIAVGLVCMVLLISFVYMNKSHKETSVAIMSTCGETLQEYNSDNFFSGLTDWADRRVGDEEAPNI